MLSPAWLFALPGLASVAVGAVILAIELAHFLTAPRQIFYFGNYWAVLAGALVGLGHIALVLALASHVHGVRAGYRRPGGWFDQLARWLTLESMILGGLTLALGGVAELGWVLAEWSAGRLTHLDPVLPAVIGALLMTLGAQTILGGFLLAILAGNEARFMRRPD